MIFELPAASGIMPIFVMEGTILSIILSLVMIDGERLLEDPFIRIDGINMLNGCHKWSVIVIPVVGWSTILPFGGRRPLLTPSIIPPRDRGPSFLRSPRSLPSFICKSVASP